MTLERRMLIGPILLKTAQDLAPTQAMKRGIGNHLDGKVAVFAPVNPSFWPK
ncbi:MULTISPECIES: hypothetical protein [unclassified Novosphingobium]|uniref:hypothetical protein n=1 Tax=unclassified Novosphingobium TaxID=2644732 RepID=UPI0025FB8332|nr:MULTISPECIES: hypothetical protein [unclassified Novosphingobium]